MVSGVPEATLCVSPATSEQTAMLGWQRMRRAMAAGGLCLLAGLIGAAGLVAAKDSGPASSRSSAGGPLNDVPNSSPPAGKPNHPVSIRQPAGPPAIATGEVNHLGVPVTANCTTCHATREPNRSTRSGEQLDEFHQGLSMQHGQLACIACHNPDDYNSLRLADGTAVPFAETMRLCAQCHGPQFRDYTHGSHGGMTGYWDLSRGPRERNNCIDCHDPHAPAYPQVHPVPGPRDVRHVNQEDAGHE